MKPRCRRSSLHIQQRKRMKARRKRLAAGKPPSA
jgi:hypothetical protein